MHKTFYFSGTYYIGSWTDENLFFFFSTRINDFFVKACGLVCVCVCYAWKIVRNAFVVFIVEVEVMSLLVFLIFFLSLLFHLCCFFSLLILQWKFVPLSVFVWESVRSFFHARRQMCTSVCACVYALPRCHCQRPPRNMKDGFVQTTYLFFLLWRNNIVPFLLLFHANTHTPFFFFIL